MLLQISEMFLRVVDPGKEFLKLDLLAFADGKVFPSLFAFGKSITANSHVSKRTFSQSYFMLVCVRNK